jgi:hypothetical protein
MHVVSWLLLGGCQLGWSDLLRSRAWCKLWTVCLELCAPGLIDQGTRNSKMQPRCRCIMSLLSSCCDCALSVFGTPHTHMHEQPSKCWMQQHAAEHHMTGRHSHAQCLPSATCADAGDQYAINLRSAVDVNREAGGGTMSRTGAPESRKQLRTVTLADLTRCTTHRIAPNTGRLNSATLQLSNDGWS